MAEIAHVLRRDVDDAELARTGAGLAGLGVSRELDTTIDGRTLWEAARRGDDRVLYWRRLAGVAARLRSRPPGDDAHALFEYAARGFLNPGAVSTDEIVVVTGFDPFRLDTDIQQSNPSGRVALTLDGTTIGTTAIVGSIFPVRFDAFDRGLVEKTLGPWVDDPRVRAIVTVSMGRDGFDLERFPGRRRSSDAPDNANVHGGWSTAHPVPAIEGPEFVEFSLPVEGAVDQAEPFSVTDNRRVRTLDDGWIEAGSLGQLKHKTAVDGSGGGYLSNEIAYRVARLRDLRRPRLAVGHIHTPRVTGAPEDRLDAIARQAIALIRAIVGEL